jgi:dTDP-4-dehydrorhamnose reductase
VRDYHEIVKIVEKTRPNFVINCIGIIKPYIDTNDPKTIVEAVSVNSLFPYSLHAAISKFDCTLIQIATDCVFDGSIGPYHEDSPHNPHDIYGKTKSLGEVIDKNVINLRCSIIGLERFSQVSLVNWFLSQPRNSDVNGFTNHLWNGLTTDAFAAIIHGLVSSDTSLFGTFHVVPKDFVSKFELLNILREKFDREDLKINPIKSEVAVDRRLATNFGLVNSDFWGSASGINQISSVKEMIQSMQIS